MSDISSVQSSGTRSASSHRSSNALRPNGASRDSGGSVRGVPKRERSSSASRDQIVGQMGPGGNVEYFDARGGEQVRQRSLSDAGRMGEGGAGIPPPTELRRNTSGSSAPMTKAEMALRMQVAEAMGRSSSPDVSQGSRTQPPPNRGPPPSRYDPPFPPPIV